MRPCFERRWVVLHSICLSLACAMLLGGAGCSIFTKQPRATAFTAGQSPDEELRAMFVTTAYNVDWPTQAGQPGNVQQNEIDAVIARAVELNCNTIFLQVRGFGDRIYAKTSINPPRRFDER